MIETDIKKLLINNFNIYYSKKEQLDIKQQVFVSVQRFLYVTAYNDGGNGG